MVHGREDTTHRGELPGDEADRTLGEGSSLKTKSRYFAVFVAQVTSHECQNYLGFLFWVTMKLNTPETTKKWRHLKCNSRTQLIYRRAHASGALAEREFPVLLIPPPKKKTVFFYTNKNPRLRAKLNLPRQKKNTIPIPPPRGMKPKINPALRLGVVGTQGWFVPAFFFYRLVGYLGHAWCNSQLATNMP